jgi:hypothetical protein
LALSERDAKQSLENLTSRVKEAWSWILGGADDETPLISDVAISIVTNLKRIDLDCRANALSHEDWWHSTLAQRVHMLIEHTKSLETYAPKKLEEWQELLLKIVTDLRVVEETLAGGNDGHAKILDILSYIVQQVEGINQVCAINKIARDDWETLNLYQKVALIAGNQQPPELRKKLNSAIWIVEPALGIPAGLTAIDRLDRITQGLQTIDDDVNSIPSADDDWRVLTLTERVAAVVAQRNQFEQDAKNVSSEISRLLKDAIFELIPSEGISQDPTGVAYIKTILQEIKSITKVVNSTAENLPENEVNEFQGKNLADRVQSIVTELSTIQSKGLDVMFRLINEVQEIPVGDFRDNVFELLRKIFPDEDIVDDKKVDAKKVDEKKDEDEKEGEKEYRV